MFWELHIEDYNELPFMLAICATLLARASVSLSPSSYLSFVCRIFLPFPLFPFSLPLFSALRYILQFFNPCSSIHVLVIKLAGSAPRFFFISSTLYSTARVLAGSSLILVDIMKTYRRRGKAVI